MLIEAHQISRICLTSPAAKSAVFNSALSTSSEPGQMITHLPVIVGLERSRLVETHVLGLLIC